MLAAVRGNFGHGRPFRYFDHQQMVRCAPATNLSDLADLLSICCCCLGELLYFRGLSAQGVAALSIGAFKSHVMSTFEKAGVKTCPGGSIHFALTIVLH